MAAKKKATKPKAAKKKPAKPKGRPLTAHFVKSVKHSGGRSPDKHCDGVNGLMLQVMPTGSRQWIQRITLDGTRNDYGLGGYPDVGLGEARLTAARNAAEARAYRRAAHRGLAAELPAFEVGRRRTYAQRKTMRAKKQVAALAPVDAVAAAARGGGGAPFGEVWTACAAERATGWKNPEAGLRNWRHDLSRPLAPIARLPAGAVSVQHLREVLAPLGPAKRDALLGKLATVFEWAIAGGHRADNPARALRATWRGLGKNGHGERARHPAMAWKDVPAFWQRLRAHGTDGGAAALAFLVLTGLRNKEGRLAEWGDLDLEERVYAVPGARMKDGRAHRVPLSDAAVEVLAAVGPPGAGPVFLGPRGKALIEKAPGRVLAALVPDGSAGVHGFRSTLRDWCSDHAVDRELAEHVLAHKVGNQVEQAYARSTMFARRAKVMEDWGRFVTGAA